MRILITGGAGYLGSELVSYLNSLEQVKHITVYDNLSRGELNFFFGSENFDKVKFVKGDILDSYRLEQVLSEIEVVIHLAAFVSEPYNNLQNLQYEQVNQWGTLSLVRCIQKSKNVKRLLYMSSSAVYGFLDELKAENEPLPANAYGTSKLKGEQYALLLKNNLDVKIIRSANIFGFSQCMRGEGVINAFFFDAIINGEIKIYGDGMQRRPFVSLMNLIKRVANWVLQNDCTDIISVDFNCDMNELKDWLLEKVENLNYQYLNQNQSFSSQSFKIEDKNLNKYKLLNETFENFQQGLRIRSKI